MTCTIVIAVEPDTVGRVASLGGELARALTARVVLAYVRKDPPLFNSNMDREQARHRSERRGRQVLDWASASLPASVEVEKRMEQVPS